MSEGTNEPKPEERAEGAERPRGKQPPVSEGRRDFLKGAGRAGLGIGFAHFLLVGGKVKQAFAAADACTEHPYDQSQDECSETDPDRCVEHGTDPNKHLDGDECSVDADECEAYVQPDGTRADSGDSCGPAPADGEDNCEGWIAGGEAGETGDYCPAPGASSEDYCNVVMPEELDVCQDGHEDNDLCTGISGEERGGDKCDNGHEDYDFCDYDGDGNEYGDRCGGTGYEPYDTCELTEANPVDVLVA